MRLILAFGPRLLRRARQVVMDPLQQGAPHKYKSWGKLFEKRIGVGVRKQIETNWGSKLPQARISLIAETTICSKKLLETPLKLLDLQQFPTKRKPKTMKLISIHLAGTIIPNDHEDYHFHLQPPHWFKSSDRMT